MSVESANCWPAFPRSSKHVKCLGFCAYHVLVRELTMALTEYATFGKFSQAATDAAVADLVEAEIADPTTESAIPPSKSTVPRKAKEDNLRLFGEEYEEQDALSLAPPRDGGDGVDVEIERLERMKVHVEQEQEGGAKIEDVKDDDKEKKDRISNPPPGFKPTRKVTQGKL